MSRLILGSGAMLMVLTVGPLTTQFSQLTMTDDGQQIYFTSPLLLKSNPGQGGIGEGRLYRLTKDGVSLAAERGKRAAPSVFSTEIGLEYPQVSGDGSVLAFTLVNVCSATDSACSSVDLLASIEGNQPLDLGRGVAQISRNGKWALLTTPGHDAPSSVLFDLSTGERTSVPNPVFQSLSCVASDGTILIEQRDNENNARYGLWKHGQITPVVTANVAPVAISDDASVALLSWSAAGYSTRWLGVKDLPSGRETMFFEQRGNVESAVFMGMSRNGSRILYRRMPESERDGDAYVYEASTRKSMHIDLPPGELVSDGTLSTSGEFAVLATSSGRLVRVNLSDNAITSLIPATAYVPNLFGLVPGSLFHLRGTVSGSLENWSGNVALNNRAVPVIYARTGDVAIQVPWTQAPGAFPLRLDVPGDTPFMQHQTVSVLPAAPALELTDPGELGLLNRKIIKGDWSGLVDNPPPPGDIIHLYMTGLGPVAGVPQTGSPTPSGSLFPITGKVACGFNGSGDLDVWENWAAETLFAGLAPGTTGIYQVSLRLPANEPAEIGWITCQVLLANGYRSTVID